MTNIWICGDLHGSTSAIQSFYRSAVQDTALEQDENWILCLGDFGAIHFLDERDDNFKRALHKYPFKYFVIRGNHEKRASELAFLDAYNGWETVEIFDNTCMRQTEFPNIYYAKDEGGIYNIQGRKTLVIPGAYSVDKYYRLRNGWAWFADEQMSLQEMEALEAQLHGQHFDLVLSHTCPYSMMPTDLFLRGVDQSTVDNSMEFWMDKIRFKMSFNLWCWGHFHADRIEAPHCEMFLNEIELLDDIERRWARYDETDELDWWLPISPTMEHILDKGV